MEFVQGKFVYTNGSVKEVSEFDANDVNKTMTYQILNSHLVGKNENVLSLKFDKLISHDITYVGIIQSAKASGIEKFPIPYALTNCHNSLCAVGGTINEDDHVYGLSAAKKYGGIYVPANQAVIHQYAREVMASVGGMILGSDSHTRYGCFGCMGVGEGGPELVKQLLNNSYDVEAPKVVLMYVTGKLRHGVGPHDVALAMCKAAFPKVKNCVLEFVGEGISSLSNDERCGIDVMTTETSCLSSIWATDEKTESFYKNHLREEDYKLLAPVDGALYDGLIEVKLDEIEPMIALPYHPSNAITIRELKTDPHKYLDPLGLADKIVDGKIIADQGVIAGCSGGMFDNIVEASDILANGCVGDGSFSLSVYPPSTPVNKAIADNGILSKLLVEGVVVKPCFCGPCFGAGDVPNNGGLSLRHTTRNFPNREGSKPAEGQSASVCLMDARSIAATALNHGVLTGADEIEYTTERKEYVFDPKIYASRVYDGFNNPQDTDLIYGPNITDWPEITPLKDDLLVKLCAVIDDPVTTTDELIPSGETSSFRSNPIRMSKFTLSRRVPEYVGLAEETLKEDLASLGYNPETTSFGSAIFANKPGDGSAREQAASCQRVLGGAANFAKDYATKRYRSNCINWGIVPFIVDSFEGKVGQYIYIKGIRKALEEGRSEMEGLLDGKPIKLSVGELNETEREILLLGSLMNYYKQKNS